MGLTIHSVNSPSCVFHDTSILYIRLVSCFN
nr:MAG TPA: hypothetical protein [Caudoviricetes sp.]